MVSEKNDRERSIFVASKNLFDASLALESVNKNLSNKILFLSNTLLEKVEKENPDVDRYVKLIGKDWIKNPKKIQNKKRFFNLEISTTNLCNFQCEYCFEKEEVRTAETLNNRLGEIIERIDMLLEDEWFNEIFCGINIDFWGGEPTLNHDLIRTVCSYYKENPKVRFHIYTNGYNIDYVKDIFIEMNNEGKLDFKMHKFTVQFSYDGSPVHNMTRTINGNPTGSKVMENFMKLYKDGVPLTFKSAIMPKHFKHLPTIWDNFNSIYEELIEINPETNGRPIAYAPTIDYFNAYKNWNLEELESSLIEIAKKELKFYEKHNRFLLNWFTKERTFCMAGITMTTIDTNGDLYYCHGCLYKSGCSDKKKLSYGTIFDDDFIDNIRNNFENIFLPKEKIDLTECENCEATFCVRCNVLVYGRSEKESFHDRWYDFSNQKNLCAYFKMISKIIKATETIMRG